MTYRMFAASIATLISLLLGLLLPTDEFLKVSPYFAMGLSFAKLSNVVSTTTILMGIFYLGR